MTYKRFIPTHVGQTLSRMVMSGSLDPVHPHACGADLMLSRSYKSSYRFIPTHVGQTLQAATPAQYGAGSSPRMWGRPAASRRFRRASAVHPHACGADVRVKFNIFVPARFIPTHVGQTLIHPQIIHIIPVHPHACGADKGFCSVILQDDGSSPRMWGRLRATTIQPFRSPVHPHACGADTRCR